MFHVDFENGVKLYTTTFRGIDKTWSKLGKFETPTVCGGQIVKDRNLIYFPFLMSFCLSLVYIESEQW